MPPAIPPQPHPHNAGGHGARSAQSLCGFSPLPSRAAELPAADLDPELLLPLAPEAKVPLVIRLAVADEDEATLQIFRADVDPCEEEASLWGENRAKCQGKAVPGGHSAIGEGEGEGEANVRGSHRPDSGSVPGALREPRRPAPFAGGRAGVQLGTPHPAPHLPPSWVPSLLGSSLPTGPWPGRGQGCALSQLPVASLHPTP